VIKATCRKVILLRMSWWIFSYRSSHG
jgi:hypothetical protein